MHRACKNTTTKGDGCPVDYRQMVKFLADVTPNSRLKVVQSCKFGSGDDARIQFETPLASARKDRL